MLFSLPSALSLLHRAQGHGATVDGLATEVVRRPLESVSYLFRTTHDIVSELMYTPIDTFCCAASKGGVFTNHKEVSWLAIMDV